MRYLSMGAVTVSVRRTILHRMWHPQTLCLKLNVSENAWVTDYVQITEIVSPHLTITPSPCSLKCQAVLIQTSCSNSYLLLLPKWVLHALNRYN